MLFEALRSGAAAAVDRGFDIGREGRRERGPERDATEAGNAMQEASHDAESRARKRRPIDDAACPARAGAYIDSKSFFVTEPVYGVQTRNGEMSWAKRGVGSFWAGAFFVPEMNEAANNTAAVKQ